MKPELPLFNEYGERLTADTCCLCGLDLRALAHVVKMDEDTWNPVGSLQVDQYAHGSPPSVCHGCERTFCVLCGTEEWDGGDSASWRCSDCNDPAVKAKREALAAYKAAEEAGQQALFSKNCPECGGRGQIGGVPVGKQAHRDNWVWYDCPACNGTGKPTKAKE